MLGEYVGEARMTTSEEPARTSTPNNKTNYGECRTPQGSKRKCVVESPEERPSKRSRRHGHYAVEREREYENATFDSPTAKAPVSPASKKCPASPCAPFGFSGAPPVFQVPTTTANLGKFEAATFVFGASTTPFSSTGFGQTAFASRPLQSFSAPSPLRFPFQHDAQVPTSFSFQAASNALSFNSSFDGERTCSSAFSSPWQVEAPIAPYATEESLSDLGLESDVQDTLIDSDDSRDISFSVTSDGDDVSVAATSTFSSPLGNFNWGHSSPLDMAEIPQAVACYDRPVLAESRTNPRLPATLTRGDSFTAENLRCQPFKHGLQRFVPRCPSAKELRLHVIGDNQDDLALLHANYQTDVEREKIFVSQREDWLGRYANLNGVHRAVVVDWLAELAEDNWIHDSTYHLAVNYFDLYMSKSNMDHVLYDLQAIAISMIFFSAKKEEFDNLPLCKILEYETEGLPDAEKDDALQDSISRILAFEREFFTITECDLNVPTAYDFMMRAFRIAQLWHIKAKRSATPGGIASGVPHEFHVEDLKMYDQYEDPFFTEAGIPIAVKILSACVCIYESLMFRNSLLAAAVFHLTYPQASGCEQQNDALTRIATGYTVAQLEESKCLDFVSTIMDVALRNLEDREFADLTDFQTKNDFKVHELCIAWDPNQADNVA